MRIVSDTLQDSHLDMQTIRRRVAQIKSQWTPEVARARAAEGARRRRELDALVGHLAGEKRCEGQAAERLGRDSHGLTLVG